MTGIGWLAFRIQKKKKHKIDHERKYPDLCALTPMHFSFVFDAKHFYYTYFVSTKRIHDVNEKPTNIELELTKKKNPKQ